MFLNVHKYLRSYKVNAVRIYWSIQLFCRCTFCMNSAMHVIYTYVTNAYSGWLTHGYSMRNEFKHMVGERPTLLVCNWEFSAAPKEKRSQLMIVEGLFQGNIFRPSIFNIFSYTRVNLNFSSEWPLLLT